jgi:hypothetical protein
VRSKSMANILKQLSNTAVIIIIII